MKEVHYDQPLYYERKKVVGVNWKYLEEGKVPVKLEDAEEYITIPLIKLENIK